MPDLFLFPQKVFFVFIMVLFHVYDVIWHVWWRALITVIYGLCIHLNVGLLWTLSKKLYSEINAKNLQYNINVILAGMYIKK